MNYTFKMYYAGSREYFVYGEGNADNKKDFPFSESLLRFLDLDYTALDVICKKIDHAITKLYREREQQYADIILSGLDELAEQHIFFQLVRLEWRELIGKAKEKAYNIPYGTLPRKQISQLPSDVAELQKQITEILRLTLDIDTTGSDSRSPAEKLAAYYRNEKRELEFTGLELFSFTPLITNFEPTEFGVFSEVFYPKSVSDLVSYSLRENIRREQKWRTCKNCKRYFPMTGRVTAEYCDRPITSSGSTCKDVGSTKTWEVKKSGEESFIIYRREYKRRFAWIRLGKWTQDEFYAWSAKAQQKKSDCDTGTISLDEFAVWLKTS
jgi:hypothetical protein